jgi:peptidoglycan endopeptidase LytF
MTTLFHQLIDGETLASVARLYRTKVSTLKNLNGLASAKTYPGQVLLVGIYSDGDLPISIRKNQDSAAHAADFTHHTVVAGDTLFNISQRFGLKVAELKALNHLSSDVIHIGQKLIVGVRHAGNDFPPPLPKPILPTVVGTIDYPQFPLKTTKKGKVNHYELTVPLHSGKTVVANMVDVPAKKPTGIFYLGQSRIKLNHKDLQAIGLTAKIIEALEFVSTFEGAYDAINTYDRAVFSYGFIQYVGLSTYGGSLNQLLTSMKNKAPDAFARIFESVGITVVGKTVQFIDPLGIKYIGDKAWYAIRKHVALFGAFVQAGFEPALVMEQYRMANVLYAQPALQGALVLNLSGKKVTGLSLQEVLLSDAMQALAIAVAVNLGNGGMKKVITKAIAGVAVDLHIKDKAGLSKLDEKAVCQKIITASGNSHAIDRAKGALKSGLSFARG